MLSSSPIDIFKTFNAVDDAIDVNADVADAILELGLQSFALPSSPQRGSTLDWHGTAKSNDTAKVHSTIRQFYRDWSKEGFRLEVQPILETIVTDLETLDLRSTNTKRPSILLPGAGLGRLLFELCLRGYIVEGNEISYHQLLASNFILNSTQSAEQFSVYPFATTFTNQRTRQDQLKEHRIPDIHPGQVLQKHAQAAAEGKGVMGEMSMTAGDFLTSYSGAENENTFDIVLTVYFIDTAPNLMRYIETIRHCLVPGGTWINIGPLLWHFDDRIPERAGDQNSEPASSKNIDLEDIGIGEPGSFELTDEEVRSLVEQMGFEVIRHEIMPQAQGGYIQDPASMMQNLYCCSHWVARKK